MKEQQAQWSVDVDEVSGIFSNENVEKGQEICFQKF